MLTTEQIRTLNDARTILATSRPPHTWEGGRTIEAYDRAQNAIFQALNVTRCYLGEPISEELMHNRETLDVTRSLGRADSISVVGDEDGFELHISTDRGVYVVNIHAVASDLYWECRKQIAEGRAAAASYRPVTDDPDAYAADDPKHPAYHSTHADLWDAREGK